MTSKTMKVSEVVYDALENRKRMDETFDDVLRRELGLTPDVEEIAAYLPDQKREVALDLVGMIDDIANFEHRIETNSAYSDFHFISPESGLTVAKAQFEESTAGSNMSLRYRGMDGDMKFITSIGTDRETDLEWELDIVDEYDELAENVREIVEGAVRKWA